MGRQPGWALALTQPLAGARFQALAQLCQPVEAIGIEQQEPPEPLQLVPQLLLAGISLPLACPQARSKHHRIKSLQGPGRFQGGRIQQDYMGLAGPKSGRSCFGHQGLEAAAAAGTSPLQAELGGAWIAGAAGHHQQATAAIFAGGRFQRGPGGRGPIRRPEGQGLAGGQGGQ